MLAVKAVASAAVTLQGFYDCCWGLCWAAEDFVGRDAGSLELARQAV